MCLLLPTSGEDCMGCKEEKEEEEEEEEEVILGEMLPISNVFYLFFIWELPVWQNNPVKSSTCKTWQSM